MSSPDLHLQAKLSAFDWHLVLFRRDVLRYLALAFLPIVCTPPLLYVPWVIDIELFFLGAVIGGLLYLGCWVALFLALLRPYREPHVYTQAEVELHLFADHAWFWRGDRGRGLAGVDIRQVQRLGRVLVIRTHDDDLLAIKGSAEDIPEAQSRLADLRSRSTERAPGPKPEGLTEGSPARVTAADWAAFNERYAPSSDRRILLWAVGAFLALIVLAGIGGSFYLFSVDVFVALGSLFLFGLLGAALVQVFRLARGHSPFYRRILERPELYEGPIQTAWGEDGVWLRGRVDRYLGWTSLRDLGRTRQQAFLRTGPLSGVVIPREALGADSDAVLKAWERWRYQARKNPPKPVVVKPPPLDETPDPFQPPRE